ncbi:UNVERIFIED_CONTAM: hypothetical protein GTU68_048129 [Idotea baltica]|nr:hypothetical protein [Idotea baltica]
MPLREIIRLLQKGVPFESLKTIPQTGVLVDRNANLPKVKKWEDLVLSSHEKCLRDKTAFAANFKHIEQESNKVQAKRLIQGVGDHNLVINPPYPPMTEDEIDTSFDLPYTRLPHPKYNKRGAIPAYEMIKFSINMHRGCFGGCSFCTISAHQGKFVASRSEESILKEVESVTNMPDFKGVISDLGGPSANMYGMKGKVQSICDRCVAPSCIHPVICSNLDTSHKAMTQIYKKVDANPKVKRAYVGSGIRYADGSQEEYMDQLVSRHVCGRLKVAPEHTSDATLRIMRKPSFKHFHEFKKKYEKVNAKFGLKQPLIPYFISSHPGSTEEEMANLAAETKDMGFRLEQVQDFTPTPMTVATIIYYTGLHPYTLRPVYAARTKKEKKKQHMFFFWHKRENYQEIKDKLTSLGRPDLIEKLLNDKKKAKKKEIIQGRAKNKRNFSKGRRKKY